MGAVREMDGIQIGKTAKECMRQSRAASARWYTSLGIREISLQISNCTQPHA